MVEGAVAVRRVIKSLGGLTYAVLVTFYGAFIVMAVVFLWRGLFGHE